MMSSIRGKNTEPEIILRRALWKRGARFRKHDRSVPGRPDISHKGAKLAVFIDGCFWHGCPEHYIAPVNNQEFWRRKIDANKARRIKILSELVQQGWLVEQVWECELRQNTAILASRLAKTIRRRRESVRTPTTPSASRTRRP